jgi:hypothetical protein
VDAEAARCDAVRAAAVVARHGSAAWRRSRSCGG